MLLDGQDPFHHRVHGFRHQPMHGHGIVPLHEVRLPAAAVEEVYHFLMAHAGEHGRIGNLVTVQVKNGQHGTVRYGIQEFIALP